MTAKNARKKVPWTTGIVTTNQSMDISSKDRHGERGQPEVKTIPVTEVSVNGDLDNKIYTKDAPPVFPIGSTQNMNVLRSRDANKASILLKTTPY